MVIRRRACTQARIGRAKRVKGFFSTRRTGSGPSSSGTNLVPTLFDENRSRRGTPGIGEWTERRETWALEPNGELKITIATSGSAEPPRTVTATYVKRGQRTEGTFAANWARTQ
jgi:hypothetical protein